MRAMRTAVALTALLLAIAGAKAQEPELLRASVDGGDLAYEARGAGEPVLLIQPGVFADAFLPLMSEAALGGYRLIRYHRRGYGESSEIDAPFLMEAQVADALALLDAVGVERAHIVGHSFGGAVALQLALNAPERVQSLAVLEPPVFVGGPEPAEDPPPEFPELLTLYERYQSGDGPGAVHGFLDWSAGPDWRDGFASRPGVLEQAEADARTLFEIDLAASAAWTFGAAEAGRIDQPLLYIAGGLSGGMSAAAGQQFQAWIPSAELVVVPTVDHAMQTQDPEAVGAAIADFIRRHPM